NAQPITIGGFAAVRLVAASALPITASASRAAAATANLPRPLINASSWCPQSLDYTAPGDTRSTGLRIRASQTATNASLARQASSSTGVSHRESGQAFPKLPLSEKISTS